MPGLRPKWPWDWLRPLVRINCLNKLLFLFFCTLCAAISFLYMLCTVNMYAWCHRFALNFFSENFTMILLFFLFFQDPVCLCHLSAGTVLCARIRHPLAGQSVLYSLSFYNFT